MPLTAQSEVVLSCHEAIACQYVRLTRRFRIYDPTLGFIREMDANALICSFQSVALALQEYYGLEGVPESNVVPFQPR